MLALLASLQVCNAQKPDSEEFTSDYILVAGSSAAEEAPAPIAEKSVVMEDMKDTDLSAGCGGDDCCDSCESCCRPKWRFWGEFLYLRPRDAEVTYAVPFDGPVVPPDDVPIQVGRVAMLDPDYSPGFRVGFAYDITPCSSLGASYTQLDSSTSDSISVDAPLVLRSMTIHPSTLEASADWLSAQATHDIDYKLADIDFRRIIACDCCYSLNYLIGARFGHLEQRFDSMFTEIGTETINTDITFDGAGIRLGLEGERRAPCSGWLIYGKSSANFVAGEFSGRYFQGSSTDPQIVDTNWKAGRIVSILELELGVGWSSCSGCFRVTGGYAVNAWKNVVKTSDFISSVQQNDFNDLNGTMTLDGLVARVEMRY